MEGTGEEAQRAQEQLKADSVFWVALEHDADDAYLWEMIIHRWSGHVEIRKGPQVLLVATQHMALIWALWDVAIYRWWLRHHFGWSRELYHLASMALRDFVKHGPAGPPPEAQAKPENAPESAFEASQEQPGNGAQAQAQEQTQAQAQARPEQAGERREPRPIDIHRALLWAHRHAPYKKPSLDGRARNLAGTVAPRFRRSLDVRHALTSVFGQPATGAWVWR